MLTRDEFKAALLRGVLTGDAGGALSYANITTHMGRPTWDALVRVVFNAENNFLDTAERCKITLDEFNKLYPRG